jgi:uncharacterized membrane protein
MDLKQKAGDWLNIQSLRAKTDERRTPAEKLADWMSDKFGSMTFLAFNAIWFAVWPGIRGLFPVSNPSTRFLSAC